MVAASGRRAARAGNGYDCKRGCHVAHDQDATGQDACFTPGDGGAHPADDYSPTGTRRFLRPAPTAPLEHPICGVTSRDINGDSRNSPITRRLHRHRDREALLPPVFFSRVAPGWNGCPWASSRASHPAVTRDARQGGDRPPRTGLGTTPRQIIKPSRCLPLHSCTLVPHVARGRLQGHHLDALRDQDLAQFEDLAGGRVHREDPAGAPAVSARHPHAHLPEAFGHGLFVSRRLLRLRPAQGALGLADKQAHPARLEAACTKAVAVGNPTYHTARASW